MITDPTMDLRIVILVIDIVLFALAIVLSMSKAIRKYEGDRPERNRRRYLHRD